MFSKILNSENLEEIKRFFEVEASQYWDTHYTFEKKSLQKKKVIGIESINILLINTIIPILFEYGQSTGNEEIKERAINYLEQIKQESNHIIKEWKKIGLNVNDCFRNASFNTSKVTLLR